MPFMGNDLNGNLRANAEMAHIAQRHRLPSWLLTFPGVEGGNRDPALFLSGWRGFGLLIGKEEEIAPVARSKHPPGDPITLGKLWHSQHCIKRKLFASKKTARGVSYITPDSRFVL
jgi:hypothetical protein